MYLIALRIHLRCSVVAKEDEDAKKDDHYGGNDDTSDHSSGEVVLIPASGSL
jgi:hypothetical protein